MEFIERNREDSRGVMYLDKYILQVIFLVDKYAKTKRDNNINDNMT